MLAGEFYLATDPQLVTEDLRAQELLFRFNMTRPGADDERRALSVDLLRELLERAGSSIATVLMLCIRARLLVGP
jgi:maltose O-acetyltransferase